MTKQSYTIPRLSWSGLPPITVEIECAATTPEGIKLGLAIKVAVGQKADLSWAYLSWADLSRADLSRASLSGAYLTRADLSWANLTGATIHGEPVTRCFAPIMRDDGFGFLAMQLEAGGVKIAAGCRWFTVAEFRAHVADEYPGTDKAVETLWILDAIERRAADLGIDLEPAQQISASVSQ